MSGRLAYALSFSMSLLQSLMIPVLVLYMLQLGYTEAEVGLVTGTASAVYIAGALLSSVLAGRLGDSKTILLSLASMATGYALLSASTGLYAILLASGVVLLGFGVFWPAVENLVSSSGGKVSAFSFSWSSGSLAGMLLVYPLSLLDPRALYAAFSASSLLLALSVRRGEERARARATFGDVLSSLYSLRASWVLCVAYSLSSSGLITFYPVLVERAGLPRFMLSLALFLMILSRTAVFFAYDALPAPLKRVEIAAPVLLASSLIPFVDNPFLHLPLSLIAGAGQGVIYGIALEGVFKSGSDRVHNYTALFESFIGAGYSLGPLLAALLGEYAGLQPLLSTSLLASLAALLAGRKPRGSAPASRG
ncbi:MFS transporter [Thermofilum pendens]|uniref:Major facilitator superfamily MFS_1 n=1 Tax=Thermofilum pendens (strain DSM 2475 / Hrk 5) TaxID=368408 RepID=A1RZA3_THEPD|nr:MFS transporter [Thermofilum pendens]ABL78533.1 major facilitator superfamily MFS_1 [Thermofilum pendens Hrk 5]